MNPPPFRNSFNTRWKVMGPGGAPGAQGDQGPPGPTRTPYDMAVERGFIGSETDWMNSLRGSQGIQGIQGPTGLTGPSGVVLKYRGTTNASGIYSVVYSVPFTTLPNLQVQLVGGTPTQRAFLTASTLTGFTVTVYQTNAVTLLGIDILSANAVLVNGATVDVVVL